MGRGRSVGRERDRGERRERKEERRDRREREKRQTGTRLPPQRNG